MRAVAICLVLLYHAGVPLFGGGYVGVDVFFVLSGFLITGVMLRDVDRTGKLSLTNFWARRARRLLPAAFFALGAASLITWLWLPLTQRVVFGKDIVSAALYVVNWRLAGRSVDYLAEDVGVSPVQHFWSLAVEEQFYIVWPLIIVFALLLARRSRMQARTGFAVAIVTAVVASLIWSVVQTGQEPITAYFSTFTRFWEIGLGAVVALSVGFLANLPDRPLAIAGWVGLAGVVVSAIWFSDSIPFPSYWALLPTAGAALMIVSGLRPVPGSPFRLLSTRPAVWLGGLSYSVYLWHWLALVAAAAWWGQLSVAEGLLVTAISFVPAALIHRFIENPIRFGERMKRPRNALAVGGVFALGSALCGVALIASINVPAVGEAQEVAVSEEAAEAPNQSQGAAAIGGIEVDWASLDEAPSITPDPLIATEDVPDAYAEGCQVGESQTEPKRCFYGDEGSEYTVLLVGDSKIVQWEPAMQQIAEQSGWQVQVMAKSGCAFSEADQIRKGGRFAACREWDEAALQIIADERPDLVLVSSLARQGISQSDPDDTKQSREAMADGYAARWRQLNELRIPVGVILDNPNPQSDVYECVAQNREALSRCAFELEPAVDKSGAQAQRAASNMVGVDIDVIDLTDLICPDQCPAVIGNVLVYRQDSHLTRTYVETLTPYLADRLAGITAGTLGAPLLDPGGLDS